MGNYRLKNGRICDGTGMPSFSGIVEIHDDCISTVIPEHNFKKKPLIPFDGIEIDCNGMFICPGFIDVHSHTDFNILADPNQVEKLSQGITTVLGGNCGLGLFPLNEEVTRYYALYGRQLFGLENPPLFGSIKTFLEEIERTDHLGINFGSFIPHGNIRAVVMGAAPSQASPEQLRLMQDAIRQNLDEGAFGLSAGLIYPPGIFSTTDELIQLCRIIAEKDAIFTCHMRDEANHVLDYFVTSG
jgi:N-acyl-D-amino-acid deacylase